MADQLARGEAHTLRHAETRWLDQARARLRRTPAPRPAIDRPDQPDQPDQPDSEETP